MRVRSDPVWREALALVRPRLVAAQVGIAAGAAGVFLLWLRLPDASVVEVAGSALLALVAIVAAGFGESRLILSLAGRSATLGRLIRGTLLLFVGAALWFAWSAWLGRLSLHDALRAGYLNSRAPSRMRELLSYEHILLWQGWMWSAIQWMGAGLIAAIVFPLAAAGRPVRAWGEILRSASFWIGLIVGCPAAALLTGALMAWLPLHGLWPEMFSLGARMTVAAVFDAVLACWLLAILGVGVRRADAGYAAPAGGPEESQPRTAEAP